jgi:hypothetical protein
MIAKAIHLLVGSRVGKTSDAHPRFERPGVTDSNSFNDSVASPELAEAVGAAIENFWPIDTKPGR